MKRERKRKVRFFYGPRKAGPTALFNAHKGKGLQEQNGLLWTDQTVAKADSANSRCAASYEPRAEYREYKWHPTIWFAACPRIDERSCLSSRRRTRSKKHLAQGVAERGKRERGERGRHNRARDNDQIRTRHMIKLAD